MFKKAEKEKLKARLVIEGPSGSGKTKSSLLIARGLVGDSGRIAMIDTEKESGKIYSDVTDFDHASLFEPFTPERYIEMINFAAQEKYDCLIIDSIAHEWAGTGGILEIHGSMPGNSYANWGKITPRHNAFINAILNYPGHIICTCRSKQAYVLETNDKGKQEPKKVGMAPQQRDDVDFEFTVVLKIDRSHMAEGDKDRTGLFPVGNWFMPSIQTGIDLAAWLGNGIDIITKLDSWKIAYTKLKESGGICIPAEHSSWIAEHKERFMEELNNEQQWKFKTFLDDNLRKLQ